MTTGRINQIATLRGANKQQAVYRHHTTLTRGQQCIDQQGFEAYVCGSLREDQMYEGRYKPTGSICSEIFEGLSQRSRAPGHLMLRSSSELPPLLASVPEAMREELNH
jgi:hypothetical protein